MVALKWSVVGIFILLFIFWPYHWPCEILVPQPGIGPEFPAAEELSLSHRATREVLMLGAGAEVLSQRRKHRGASERGDERRLHGAVGCLAEF